MVDKEQDKLTKAKILKSLQGEVGMANADSNALMSTFFSTLKEEIQGGTEIKFQNLGTFKKIKTKAKTARDFATDEIIELPEGEKIRFVSSKVIKDAIEGSGTDLDDVE